MVICGSILARSNYEEFFLSCSQCENYEIEIDNDNWKQFVLHVREHLSEVEKADLDLKLEVSDSVVEESNKDANEDEDDDMAEEGAAEDCLAETTFVDLPVHSPQSYNSDDEDSEYEDFDMDCSSGAGAAVEQDSSQVKEDKLGLAPTAKFNPTFYRRSPRITQFIELYQAQPCLWDPKDESFGNKQKRLEAYDALMEHMKTTVNVHLTPYKLKKAIKSLHTQYAAITRQKKTQKLTQVPLYYHEKYGFLKERGEVFDEVESEGEAGESKIKLIFTESNQLTTLFIELYSKFPHLYDPSHQNFANLAERKSAYIEITERLTEDVPLEGITQYDVYDSIQCLRQWYSRRIKGLTELQTVGLVKAEKRYIDRCKSFMPTKTFRQKIPCEVCKQKFSTDHALQAHQYRAHRLGDGGWFRCPLCELNFERRCHLQQHNQRVHLGKTYSCTLCDRSFVFAHLLTMHQRTHEEEYIAKPFVCEFCGKSFKQKIQMKNHVTAVHTKIRAFKCTMCPKDFLTKRDLTEHVKAHLNIRDKVCEICQKAFCSANALVKHRHIHREKTLQCSLCTTRFSERVSLGVHMKRTHKIIRNNPKPAAETFPHPTQTQSQCEDISNK